MEILDGIILRTLFLFFQLFGVREEKRTRHGGGVYGETSGRHLPMTPHRKE